jgi:uncharacterized membrane protein YkvA (DUF1232 family)
VPDLPSWQLAVLIVVVLYLTLVAVLMIVGRGLLAREIALLLPNLLRLFRGLMGDPDVPRRAKIALGFGAVWIASPIDLIPEFIPIAGQLDDAVVAALVLAYVVRASGRQTVERHWHGDPATIRRLLAFVT